MNFDVAPNIHMEGTVSQILDTRPSFNSIVKDWKLLATFSFLIFYF